MTFSQALLDWYDREGRVLPFRGTKDPYRVWLSEIMLQQTRTESVGAYYARFLERFPDVRALAAADEQDVLTVWQGLGYYSRARNLLRAARIVVDRYGGSLPADVKLLRSLPGIGDYTAAAIASIAFSLPEPAMDGNLNRVFARVTDLREDISLPHARRALRQAALDRMEKSRPGDLNQALMDLGATVCVPGTPDCARCPIRRFCLSHKNGTAEDLPVMPQRTPQRTVDLNVILVIWDGRVYMVPRRETLLKGMYVFLLSEDGPARAMSRLGLSAPAITESGRARHVFTHLIWQMRIYMARVPDVPEKLRDRFYTLEQMRSLPLPTAMRAAEALAEKELTK